MKLLNIGTNILEVEVTNISNHGFWILINEKEYFLDFIHFPWFKNATISDICSVQLTHKTHLYWEVLDIDLNINQIEQPELYPLVSK